MGSVVTNITKVTYSNLRFTKFEIKTSSYNLNFETSYPLFDFEFIFKYKVLDFEYLQSDLNIPSCVVATSCH